MCFSPLPFTIKSINTCLRTLNKVELRLNQYHVGMDYMINAGIGFLVRLNLPLIHLNDTNSKILQTIGPVYNSVTSKSMEGL